MGTRKAFPFIPESLSSICHFLSSGCISFVDIACIHYFAFKIIDVHIGNAHSRSTLHEEGKEPNPGCCSITSLRSLRVLWFFECTFCVICAEFLCTGRGEGDGEEQGYKLKCEMAEEGKIS